MISGVNPASGPAAGGTTVTITGENFGASQGTGSVTFGGTTATVTSWSDTQIITTTPVHGAGAVDVVVTGGTGETATRAGGFTYLGPPAISGVTPGAGTMSGGTAVTITGTNFGSSQGTGAVTFGGTAATVTSWTNTQIIAATPAHAAGSVDVTITRGDGQSATLANSFTYSTVVTSTFYSTDLPKSITDNTTAISRLTLADNITISDLNVKITLTHTYDSDLDIYLKGPDGTRIELSTDNGGSNNDYTNTVFDDEATTSITAGAAPFSGTYKPEQLLSAFDGKNTVGTWSLEIFDGAGGDTGSLTAWSLTITGQGAQVNDSYLEISPASHAFGTQQTGTTSAFQTFTVSVAGNYGDLDITSAAYVFDPDTGDAVSDYIIQNDTCAWMTLSPGESCTVAVAFAPTKLGSIDAKLEMTSNVDDGGGVGATLTGIGTAQPNVITGPVSYSGGDITLTGAVTPNNLAGTAWFEWGVDPSYGNTTTVQNLGSGAAMVSFSDTLTDLVSGSTYYYRAAAENALGIVYGAGAVFTVPRNQATATGLSVNSHWYNWADNFDEYDTAVKRFNFVRDGAWWSVLEPDDHVSTVDWDNADWSYAYDVSLANCSQSVTYQSGFDELVRKFQEADSPELLLVLDIHNNALNLDANAINYSQYYDFVYQLVERYDGDGYRDMPGLVRPVRYFEIGNEVDSDNPAHSHNLTLENYVTNRLKPAYQAAKDANPTAVIMNAGLVLGGDAGFDTTYLEEMLNLIANNKGDADNFFMDRLAVHYYTDPQNPEYFDQNIKSVQNILESHGIGGKPIWLTEFGLATKSDGGGTIREVDQASALLRYAALIKANRVENAFVYNLKDVHSGAPSNWENVYGLLKVVCQGSVEQISDKAAMGVLETFHSKTQGMGLQAINSQSERDLGIYRLVFGSGTRKLQVLWYTAFDLTGVSPDHSSETTDIQVNLDGGIGVLRDMYGAVINLTVADGATITIGEAPVYIDTITEGVFDTDGDGLPDTWEIANGLDPDNPADAALDADNDGLTNIKEYEKRTNPRSSDSDNDGMEDGWEVDNGLDPNVNNAGADLDGDGLTNIQELNNQTDPNNQDTDGDGVTDGQEVTNGTNPRAYSSSLTADVSSLRMALGASQVVVLTLANNSTESDTFNISVSGAGPAFFTLGQNQAILSAGELREIPLTVHVPLDCNLSPLSYTIHVDAVSPTSGAVVNGGVDINLQVFTQPTISELNPLNGDSLATNSVTFSWATDVSASTDIYYRIAGEPSFTRVSGSTGTAHVVELANLTWDKSYEWYAESAGACAGVQSGQRTLFVQDGLVFKDVPASYEIVRDYNQAYSVTIENRDQTAHSVLVTVVNPYDDLIIGFTGSGSMDEQLSLGPGESTQVTLALHAQDAKANEYPLVRLELIADGETANPIIDSALVHVTVRDPDFRLTFVETGQDPAMLTNTYRITNTGLDPITDLKVYAEEETAPLIMFQPQINHGLLSPGQSITFSASYQPEGMNGSLSTLLTAEGAGRTFQLATHFGCPAGTSLYTAAVADAHICLEAQDHGCTNRGTIGINFNIPKGVLFENINQARLYTSFTLTKPRSQYRTHDIIAKMNEVTVKEWLNTVPSGAYAVNIPPSVIKTGTNSIGYNKLTLKTRNMNGGSYIISSNHQLILDLDELTGSRVCAASQAEANQAVLNFPYICDGVPNWNICPDISGVKTYDTGGQIKNNFNPGQSLKIHLVVSNPDIIQRAMSIDLEIDDNFSDATPGSTISKNINLAAGGIEIVEFDWTVPEGTPAEFYSLRVHLGNGAECNATEIFTGKIGINLPVRGTVRVNETNRVLAGAEVCGWGFGGNNVFVDCATTDENGEYTLYLPRGRYAIHVYKERYSLDTVITDIPALASVDLTLSFEPDKYGEGSDNPSGFTSDPVNTALGNFTLSAEDLAFKGRGLAFSFGRFYNSRDPYNGPLGYGWTHSYNIHLIENGGEAYVKYGDGREEYYVEQANGSFLPQPGGHSTLVREGDGSFSLTNKNLIVYHFDSGGHLTAVSDRNSNTITLAYDGSGRLDSVTDPVGRSVQFSYDVANHITQLTDPIGRMARFEYDANGDLVSAFDAMDYETVYTYDDSHQMLTATDPAGNVFVTNEYDDQNRVVSTQKDALGNITRFSYDRNSRTTTIVDPLGFTTVHQHDSRNRLVNVTDPRRYVTTYEYDADNNRTRAIDKRGSETLFAYDDMGNLTSVIDALGNETSFTYDNKNNPTAKTDALGNTTTLSYDVNGNLVKISDALLQETNIAVTAFGSPQTVTDARGNTVAYAYDDDGNPATETDALGNITTYSYDGVSRLTSGQDAKGNVVTYEYDANNNLLKTHDPAPFSTFVENRYDRNNRLTRIIDRLGNSAVSAYDAKGRLTSLTDPLGNTISYTYDALDRRLSVTDPRGNITRYAYDGTGNRTSMTDSMGSITRYGYDSNGNLVELTTPSGRRTTYVYDALNRGTAITDPLANTTTLAYDALGRMIARTDAATRTTHYEYDVLGRQVKVIDPAGLETAYAYDSVGNRIGYTDANGHNFTYQYDAGNRLIADADGYEYQYDPVGNLTRRIDAMLQQTAYSYDKKNRLTAIHYPSDGDVTFSLDANGNVLTMVDSLGTTTRQHDALNRLIRVTDSFGQIVAYGYDAAGNRATVTYPDSKVVNYSYDPLNRLASVTDWQGRTTTYAYDGDDLPVGVAYPNGTSTSLHYDGAGRMDAYRNINADSTSTLSSHAFTLDPVGRKLQEAKVEPLVPFLKGKSVNYTYDQENKIATITGGTIGFDVNGSTLNKTIGTKTTSYDWDDANRLSGWSAAAGAVDYLYDGLGNRLRTIRAGVTTNYVLDVATGLTNVLAETDDSGVITAWNIFGLGLIGREDSQGIHYYHYDAMGNTLALSDMNGAVTDSYAYDPFGEVANRTGSTNNPFTFVGRYGLMDEGNGLYFVRARYYDSTLGRFLNKDVYQGDDRDPRTLHRYVYTSNNPLGMVDVSGLCGEEASDSFWGSDLVGFLGEGAMIYAKSKVANNFISLIKANKLNANLYSQHAGTLKFLYNAGQVLQILSLYEHLIDEVEGENFSLEGWFDLESWKMLGGLTNDDVNEVLAGYAGSVTAVSWNTIMSPYNFALKMVNLDKYDVSISGEELQQKLNNWGITDWAGDQIIRLQDQ